jgi:uncharacterized protein
MLPHATLADIPPAVRAQILARLDDIARAERIRIILAVESGSRAWGFASADSDYDVRFLYVRRVEDYAALTVPRDVIERPLEGEIDLSGWDLRKALSLGLRWNPALVEWLTSPIVYAQAGWEADALRGLFAVPQSRTALIRHYYGLASRQFGRNIDGRAEVNLKKYFYVVRPAAALLWLETRGDETPPMSLPALLDGVALPADVVSAIVDLRARKARGVEAGKGARIAALDAFCVARMEWARAHLPKTAQGVDPALRAAAEALFHASVFGLGPPQA